ncbi:14298_t:CDS:1, partial [Racocetra persica]
NEEDRNNEEYITECEIEEVIKIGQILPPLQQNKRRIETQNSQENKKYKLKFEEKIVNTIDNIELTKESKVNIIKDAISISGK